MSKQNTEDNSSIKEDRYVTVSGDIEYTIKVWKREVLYNIDYAKKRNAKIVQTLRSSIISKENRILKNQHFLEKIARFGHCDLKQEPNEAWAAILGVPSPIEGKKTFRDNLMQLTKNLYMIEKFGELEVERLKNKVHEFMLEKIGNPPVNKKDIGEALLFAQQCAVKEKKAKLHHEKAVKTVVDPYSTIVSKVFNSPARMRWDEAMTKSQYLKARKLTTDAIIKANIGIKAADKRMKLDLIEFLIRYIEIEMIQHCKALEHLSDAFALANTCRAMVAQKARSDLRQPGKTMQTISEEPEYKVVVSQDARSRLTMKSFADLFSLVPQYSKSHKDDSHITFHQVLSQNKQPSGESIKEEKSEDSEKSDKSTSSRKLSVIHEEDLDSF